MAFTSLFFIIISLKKRLFQESLWRVSPFGLHRVHPEASMKTPENTKNLMLIVEKTLVQFSIAFMKFIHSFDVDIEQS